MNDFLMKRACVGIFFVVLLVHAVPPPSDVELLIGARFKTGDQLIDDNPYLTPLAGAVAWHSGLITGLLRHGPFVSVVDALGQPVVNDEGRPVNGQAITNLVNYLFRDMTASVMVSQYDSRLVAHLIEKNKWLKIAGIISDRSKIGVTAEIQAIVGGQGRVNFTPLMGTVAQYARQPVADFPVQIVELILSAVWYATIKRIEGRSDIGWVEHGAELREFFEKLSGAVKGFAQLAPSQRERAQHDFIETIKTTSCAGVAPELCDEVALTLLLYSQLSIGYPAEVAMARVSYHDEIIPDCVESSLHNIINLLVYDPDNDEYNPRKYVPADAPLFAKLVDYYTKYPRPLGGISDEACAEWFGQLQRIAKMTYVREDHELKASWDNIDKVLQRLSDSDRSWISVLNTVGLQRIALDGDTLVIEKIKDGSITNTLRAKIFVRNDPTHGHAEVQFKPLLLSVVGATRSWRPDFDRLARLLRTEEQEAQVDKPVARFVGLDDCAWLNMLGYTAPTIGAWMCDCVRVLEVCLRWSQVPVMLSALRSAPSSLFSRADTESLRSVLQLFWSSGDVQKKMAAQVVIQAQAKQFIGIAVRFDEKTVTAKNLDDFYQITSGPELLAYWVQTIADTADPRKEYFLRIVRQQVLQRLYELPAQDQRKMIGESFMGVARIIPSMRKDERLKLFSVHTQNGGSFLGQYIFDRGDMRELVKGISPRELRDAMAKTFDEVILAVLRGEYVSDDESAFMIEILLKDISAEEWEVLFKDKPLMPSTSSSDGPVTKLPALPDKSRLVNFVSSVCAVDKHATAVDSVLKLLFDVGLLRGLTPNEKTQILQNCEKFSSPERTRLRELLA